MLPYPTHETRMQKFSRRSSFRSPTNPGGRGLNWPGGG